MMHARREIHIGWSIDPYVDCVFLSPVVEKLNANHYSRKKEKKRYYDDLESIGVLEFGYMLRPYE